MHCAVARSLSNESVGKRKPSDGKTEKKRNGSFLVTSNHGGNVNEGCKHVFINALIH